MMRRSDTLMPMDGEVLYAIDTFSDEDAVLDYAEVDLDILAELASSDEKAAAELAKREAPG